MIRNHEGMVLLQEDVTHEKDDRYSCYNSNIFRMFIKRYGTQWFFYRFTGGIFRAEARAARF
jgi:hypothetical protein